MNDKIVNDFTSEVVSLNKDQEFVYELSAEEENEKIQKTLIEIANKEGMECGKEQEKINTAKNLLTKGMDIAFIQEITGLKKSVINQLI